MAKLRNSFTKAEVEDALLGYINGKFSSTSDTRIEGSAKNVNVEGRQIDIEFSYDGQNLRGDSSEVVITDFILTGGGETFLFSDAALSGDDFFINVRRANF